MSEWISIKDELPELLAGEDYSENVLASNGKKLYVMALFHDADGWSWGNCYGFINGNAQMDDDYSNITHWMPLPTPPKEQESNNEQVPDFFFMENDLMGKR